MRADASQQVPKEQWAGLRIVRASSAELLPSNDVRPRWRRLAFVALAFVERNLSHAGFEIADRRSTKPTYNVLYEALRPQGRAIVDIQGFRLLIDADTRGVAPKLLLRGIYEPGMTRLLKRLVQRGMLVVDVGAHCGYMTMIAAHGVGASGLVYALEPAPAMFDLLDRNVRLNELRNVVALPYAASSTAGAVSFYLDRRSTTRPSFSAENLREFGSEIRVHTLRLDDILDGRDCDLLKIDTQGAELLVVDGALDTLERSDAIVLCEFWPAGLRNVGSDPNTLLQRFADLGYQFALVDDRSGRPQPCSRAQVAKMSLTLHRFDQPLLLLLSKTKGSWG